MEIFLFLFFLPFFVPMGILFADIKVTASLTQVPSATFSAIMRAELVPNSAGPTLDRLFTDIFGIISSNTAESHTLHASFLLPPAAPLGVWETIFAPPSS
ncbi:hypothetical protein [Pseudoflavonifractor sp. AF19-9AC]|uniref:hypothetical protein n=1 Tax=Pseudoflavonifractor sp. AF19-9AC TaxID=2292244 RepID=UPI0011C484AA|nr:hypothetical protein [Pseudoflavonifractor sp. AF19-9AC]